MPSGAYSCSARSYKAAFLDCQDEDLSLMVTGLVSVNSAQTKTIIIDFNSSPLLPHSGVVATFLHPASIDVCWDAVTGADTYNLYWSTTRGVTKVNGTKIEGVTSCYRHAPVSFGSTCFYVITEVR